MAESSQVGRRPLYLSGDMDDIESLEKVFKALASAPRLRILELLHSDVYNLSAIAQMLDMSLSTANLHVTILEEAGLLNSELHPASRGRQKICARAYDTVVFNFAQGKSGEEREITYTTPLGAYVNANVSPTCGLASENGIIGLFDDPLSFFEPERMNAQLLWFHHGTLEYRFPNRLPPHSTLDSLQISAEICSEAPLHHNEWPSDITLWINDVEVGYWTCPSDFGDQRGLLSPSWWENWNSQYGLLKVWRVDCSGSYVDDTPISGVCLQDLHLDSQPLISVKIGVKPDAEHVGGINIFGRQFGNYPQDIVLRLTYH